MKIIERNILHYPDKPKYQIRYALDSIFENSHFDEVIQKLGGYTYNVCVGKVRNDEVTVFNGYTWLGVESPESYEDCESWAKKVMENM